MLVLDLITDYVNKLTFSPDYAGTIIRFYVLSTFLFPYYSYQIQFIIFHIGKFML